MRKKYKLVRAEESDGSISEQVICNPQMTYKGERIVLEFVERLQKLGYKPAVDRSMSSNSIYINFDEYVIRISDHGYIRSTVPFWNKNEIDYDKYITRTLKRKNFKGIKKIRSKKPQKK